MTIFKAYDIRGIVPDPLGPQQAYAIGRASARFLGGAGDLAVGEDARTHSPELCSELIRGLTDEGASVARLGLVSTPMMYYAVEEIGAIGGITEIAREAFGKK